MANQVNPDDWPEVQASQQFAASLKTPEGMMGLEKVLSTLHFPTYCLVNPPLEFHLVALNTSTIGQKITAISFVFALPSHSDPVAVLMVSTISREAYPEQWFGKKSIYNTVKSLLTGYLPRRYTSSVLPSLEQRWADVERFWDEKLSRDLIDGSSIRPRSQMASACQDWLVPISVAYWDAETIRIVVGSIGLPQAEFAKSINSVTLIQIGDNYLATMRRDRVMALEALRRDQDHWGMI